MIKLPLDLVGHCHAVLSVVVAAIGVGFHHERLGLFFHFSGRLLHLALFRFPFAAEDNSSDTVHDEKDRHSHNNLRDGCQGSNIAVRLRERHFQQDERDVAILHGRF